MIKKFINLAIFIYWVGAFISVLGNLQAQSFLSNLRNEMVDPGLEASTDNKLTDLYRLGEAKNDSFTQPSYKILSRTLPMLEDAQIGKNQIEADIDLIIRDISNLDESHIALEMSFDLDALFRISQLITKGEFSLASATLQKLSTEVDESLDYFEKFRLVELRNYLVLKTNYYLGDYEQVIEYAKQYFQEFSNGEHYYQSYYYFAASLSYLNKPLELTSLVTEEFFEQLSKRQSSKLRQFLIQDALNNKEILTAISYLEDSNGELIQGYERWISNIVEKIDDIGDVDALLESYDDNLIKSYSYFRKIQLLVREGDYTTAQNFLDYLMAIGEVDAEMFVELQSLQSFITIALNTEPHKIGVILPISHRQFGPLARQVLDGLELALQKFVLGDKPIQLVIKDSAPNYSGSKLLKGNARLRIKERVALVKNQVRELVEKDRVIAILGPLARQTSLAAGEMAATYKIPVISFSKTENIGKELPFLFRFQRNQTMEALALAHYAMDYLNAERFVLLYPSDTAGKGFRMAQAFGREVKKQGGIIVGVSRIRSKQMDFTDIFKSITGGFRKKSEEEMAELERTRETISPIVDFDAIFVPVKPHILKIVIDFSKSFEAQAAWILAGSEINARENQLLRTVAKLRFVDNSSISSIRTYLQPFYEAHWKAYNYRPNYSPPTDYTIYAYEAMEIIAKLLNDPRNHNREFMRDAVQNLADFPVLTGKLTTLEGGEISKSLKILRIKGKNTVSVF